MRGQPDPWTIAGHRGPIVATAIHAGHALRADAVPWMALDAATRLREEDPYTDCWTAVGDTRIVVRRSRFEFDLNRPREGAIYRRPADAWGLTVWRPDVPGRVLATSLSLYDRFYDAFGSMLRGLIRTSPRVVVLDLHSYNYRRNGPDQAADAAANPDINVGTGSVPRRRWQRVIGRFLREVTGGRLAGRPLSVGENVKFQGGHLAAWVHETFPTSVCVLAVEVKKVFMDEWSGRPKSGAIADIGRVLERAAQGIREELA